VILDYQRPGIPDYSKPYLSDDDGDRRLRGLLVPAFIGVLLFFQYGLGWMTGTTCRNSATAGAKTDIMMLGSALDLYKADVGQYPADADGLAALNTAPPGTAGWHGPYLRRHAPNDPWGRPYVYHATRPSGADPYTLLSRGPDGVEGTKDDIVNK
jgi:type II secretion system protein G